MAYVDFLSSVHGSTERDYLGRVNDREYPKALAAELSKKWGFDYWDGDRRICYGGYNYMPGRWKPVAEAMITHYGLKPGDRVLDIGCGKAFLLYEMTLLEPGLEITGLDISQYAIANSKEEIRQYLMVGNANRLPFEDNRFDYVYSLNTLHNLRLFDLIPALTEIERVCKRDSYVCVESYITEQQKANLLYWQVTCESFFSPEHTDWCFNASGYEGDHSFIYFD